MTNNKSPKIHVGIMSSRIIHFVLNDFYELRQNHKSYKGLQKVKMESDKIIFDNNSFDRLDFISEIITNTFDLKEVVIGKNFHWQQTETQRFEGEISFITENSTITAINTIPVENYLKSVISSEMSATSSLELLKAHAVISRSWLISQISKPKKTSQTEFEHKEEGKLVKWYDHDDHVNFDVCADDHCQRYQGVTRETTSTVAEAIRQTSGEVLTYKGEICDARFSKSCGGVTELYENCWDNTPHPYLARVVDAVSESKVYGDLSQEKNAIAWIKSTDENSFCNTHDTQVLSEILNNYDQTTHDFYRWKTEYSQMELKQLIEEKTHLVFGDILDLLPIERGVSGRLVLLKIVGSKRTLVIGKELEIRRTLSKTHLYSSAFYVDKVVPRGSLIPSKFILYGAGWGHGVGLCQIGAAVMAHIGYGYKEILLHYYIGANLSSNYGKVNE